MAMLSGFHPEMYFVKVCSLIFGCAVLAFGISLEVLADVTMLSGEYTVQIAARRFKREFALVKVLFDWTLVIIAIAISLSYTGTVEGVREGTVIAAFITGPFVKFFGKFVKPISNWFVVDRPVPSDAVAISAANSPIIITIAREYGSGGHDLGKKIADDLGIKFYDNQLITMVAQESGMTESDIRQHEQSVNPNILLRMVMHDYEAPIEKSLSPSDASFVATSRVVRKIATEGDCVIVGRCSDWILRDMPNCINVFIHADMPYKVERAIANYGLNPNTAAQEIDRINRSRAAHYQHYTGKVWTDVNNYHLVCDSSHITVEQISTMIEALYKQRKQA
jgi:cytidylate kinase